MSRNLYECAFLITFVSVLALCICSLHSLIWKLESTAKNLIRFVKYKFSKYLHISNLILIKIKICTIEILKVSKFQRINFSNFDENTSIPSNIWTNFHIIHNNIN